MILKKSILMIISLCLVIVFASISVLSGCSSSTPTTTSVVTQTSITSSSATSNKVYEFKFTSQFTDVAVQGQMIKLLSDTIIQKTSGQVKFNHFGSESMGKATDFLNMLDGGVADAAFLATGMYPAQFDIDMGPELPGLGISGRQVRMDLTWELFNKGYLKGLEPFKVLAFVPGSDITLFLKKEAPTIDDLKGLKIRTTGPVVSQLIEAFGASPVAMTYADQYMSLERGVIDGTITAYEAFLPAKTYEVCKYAITDNLVSSCLYMVMSKKAWNTIPVELQVKVDEAIQAFRPLLIDLTKGPDSAWKDTAKQYGMTIYSFSSEDKAKLKTLAAPIQKAWIADHEAKGQPAQEMMDYINNYIANLK